jgi:poly(A) polymerase
MGFLQAASVSSTNKIFLSSLISKIADLLPPDCEAYLVGGAVRDMLLSRQSHDLDIAITGDVMEVTRKLANQLGAAFYPMDPEHGVARLILQEQVGEKIVLDVASLRGSDLNADLRSRDFTVNAIALDIRNMQEILDPLSGLVDLHEKRLVPCLPSAISDDPVRVLRGLRLAAAYGLKIPPETRQKMRQAAVLLPSVSPERMRDELFRILDGTQPSAVLQGMEMLGALSYVLPELSSLKGVEQSSPHIEDVWHHTFSVLAKLEKVLELLGTHFDEEKASSLIAGLLVMRLGCFRQHLANHLDERLNPDRTLRALLYMAALYHDSAKPETKTTEPGGRIRFLNHENIGAKLAANRGKSLRLSNNEIDRMERVVAHHMRPLLLAQAPDRPTSRAIYRYFRATGKAGIDICLLSLSDTWAAYGETLPQAVWMKHLDVVRDLMEAWWEKPEQQVNPTSFVNGIEIMNRFQLTPGPIIGDLLETVREAQAMGIVHSKEDAFELIRKKISNPKED